MFSLLSREPVVVTSRERQFTIGYRGLDLKFAGGPFRSAPSIQTAFLVKMAAEQSGDADVTVAVHDFTAPDPNELLRAVRKAIKQAMRGNLVFAGCGAGIGRTGTFMAAVLKVFFDDEPVMMVRRWYLPHAVETQDQKALLHKLDVKPIRRKLFWWALRARLGVL